MVILLCPCVSSLPLDPNMVNAYMYQPAGTNGQPAPPGQAPPTTSPPYSNYQPTPTQGYQVMTDSHFQFMITTYNTVRILRENEFCAECGLSGPEYAPDVSGRPDQRYGLHGLPAVQHAEHDLSVARAGPQYAPPTAVHARPAAHVPAGQLCYYFFLCYQVSAVKYLPTHCRYFNLH